MTSPATPPTLITGASSGLGAEMARQLAQIGLLTLFTANGERASIQGNGDLAHACSPDSSVCANNV